MQKFWKIAVVAFSSFAAKRQLLILLLLLCVNWASFSALNRFGRVSVLHMDTYGEKLSGITRSICVGEEGGGGDRGTRAPLTP